MGCAAIASGLASEKHNSIATNRMRVNLWVRICDPLGVIWVSSLSRGGIGGVRGCLKCGARDVSQERMESRIQGDGAAQIVVGFFVFAKTLIAHAGVK